MSFWDPFNTNSQEISSQEEWIPSWEGETFEPRESDLGELKVEDFFSDMTWATESSLKGLGTEPPPAPKKLADELSFELEFADDPGKTFRNYFKDPSKQHLESQILFHLSKSTRFIELFLLNPESFEIENEKDFELLYHSVISQFGPRSEEALKLYIYGAKSFKGSSIYSESLLLIDPKAFLKHAPEFDLEPNPQLIRQISKQGIEYQLLLAKSCGPKWLERTSLEPFIPFLEEVPVPFSWERFAENMKRFDIGTQKNFFQVIEPLVDLKTACNIFSTLELEDEDFARKVFLASPSLFGVTFQSKLYELAQKWIDTPEIFQGFPFALIEEEEKRAEIAYQLAQKDPFQLIPSLPLFKGKNEELFMPTFEILATAEPKEFVLIMGKLHFRSRKNLKKLSNLLLESQTGLTPDAKENFSLFLTEFLSLRLGEKKEEFLKYLFEKATLSDLEMLFSNLPLTQNKTKCVNAFVPAVFARFVRGKEDDKWEKKAANNHSLFRDNVYAQASIMWMHQIIELKERFNEKDIEYILNQLFYGNESVSKRLDLLRSLLELRMEVRLAVSDPLPLSELESMFDSRAKELLDLPDEPSAALTNEPSAALTKKVRQWRSPFALFKFLIKVDTLEESKRVIARAAVREFLLSYLNDSYETWRYERSPHLNAMRDQGLMNESLESWWRTTPDIEDLDSQHTIEITSDPVDFFLCGDECGGCQHLSNKIEHVLPILGLMDGMFKMVVIRNKQTKKMVTRSFVRWVSDKEGKKPVLLLEPPYTLNYNSGHAPHMLNYLKKHVSHAPEEFPLVISPHFSKTYQHHTTPYPHPLHAEGSFAPLVFSDTLGFERTNGEGGIKTDGNYVLEHTAAVI